MIYRLRRRFIRICTLSFLGVFLALLAAIFLVTDVQTARALDALADVVAENGGSFPAWEGQPHPPEGLNRESPFTTRFFTVRIDSAGQVASVDLRAIASVTEAEAEAYATRALARGSARGWDGDFRYKLYDTDEGMMAVFISGTDTREMHRRFLLAAAGVFVAGSLVVLALVVFFSRRAVKPAAESEERQKRFVTDASHELKTPLTLIRANLEILEEEQGPSEWLTDIRNEADDMTALVDRLVQLSRMDEAAESPERESFSLSEMAEEAAAAFAPAMAKSGRTLVTDLAPDVLYTGSASDIRQLFSILLDNAGKYCDPAGEIRLSLSGGRHPVLTVDNTFAAVGETDLSRLFDRFYRADPARTAGGGWGIGLSIAQAIAARHHGDITVQALGGHTIRFRVRL